MKIADILEYKTRHGKKIEFKKTLDSESENRGYIVHRLDAFVGGIHAGYLKISYIPAELFTKFNPTIFHWMANFAGKTTLIPYDKELTHYTEFDRKEKIRLLQYWSGSYSDINRDFSEFSDDDLTNMIQDIESRILKGQDRDTKNIKKKYDEFIEWHVDKPKVDFIDVRTKESFNQNYTDDKPEDFRRQGIALALYQEGAKWMNSMGLRLYASTLQQPEAEAAWNKMDGLGWVDLDGKRLYLNPQKLPQDD
jgi:hypothetical protein